MPKEYITIAGVEIPTDLNKRNAYQRGIILGWEADKTDEPVKCPVCGKETDWCDKCKMKYSRRNEWLRIGDYDGRIKGSNKFRRSGS